MNKPLKFRTPTKCQNGHFRWYFYEVSFGQVFNTRWGDKHPDCNCPTASLDQGFEKCGPDDEFTGMQDTAQKDIYASDVVTRMCTDQNCTVDHTGVVFYSVHWGEWQIKEKGFRLEREMSDYHPPLMFGDLSTGVLLPITIVGHAYEE